MTPVELPIVVSFGSGEKLPNNAQFARITHVRCTTWGAFAAALSKQPRETDDKSELGWYSSVEYDPQHRNSENFIARYCLTFDYDHVTRDDVVTIRAAYMDLEYVLYTTWSHTAEAPRLRMVLPLSRPAGYDEFQAISRKVAERAGIELASRESHVPAQIMYLPAVKPGAKYGFVHNTGEAVDVDAVLAEYEDWTDRKQWPKRSDGDGVHSNVETQTPPDEKPGIVGDFCRAFDVYKAIERFELPYVPTATPDRLTYSRGSRPEGAVVYDGGRKLHSHHDTDPARGQTNAFDLVRLHRFHALDDEAARDLPITQRPSYRAMCELAREQPEVQAVTAAAEFEDLGPLTPEEAMPADHAKGAAALARRICDVLRTPTIPRWLLRDRIERGVIALMAGPRGSYKSFLALDWTMRIAVEQGETVYAISAEGGDYDRRARAWLQVYAEGRDPSTVPLFVVEKRLNLNHKDNVKEIVEDCVKLGARPSLFVLDTFSKLSGGLEENDNTEVKQFIGWLDVGLKRHFDATVLLVAHTGHADKTRARGASALGADTDAEYIVARDEASGTVSLSRERFKSSPELEPLHFKPEVVNLGYADEGGQPVTSLVMREAVAPIGSRRLGPMGKNQRLVYGALRELAPDGNTVSVSRLMDVSSKKLPYDSEGGKRDKRREHCERAVSDLAVRGDVHLSGDGEMVSITRASVTADSEFEEEAG